MNGAGGTVNKAVSAAALAAAAALFARSVFGLLSAEDAVHMAMSPWLFPAVISVAGVSASAVLTVRAFRTPGRDGEKAAQDDRIRVFLTAALCVLYIVWLKTTSFIPASIVFLGMLMLVLGEKRMKVVIPAAVIVTLALYALFALLLKVRLP